MEGHVREAAELQAPQEGVRKRKKIRIIARKEATNFVTHMTNCHRLSVWCGAKKHKTFSHPMTHVSKPRPFPSFIPVRDC